MTITKLIYRCDRESLGGQDGTAFADAFEAELMAYPEFRDAEVEYEFGDHRSGLHAVHGDDLPEDPVAKFAHRVLLAAERAFAAIL